jgi:phospholipid-binding lipoprotein MlaA
MHVKKFQSIFHIVSAISLALLPINSEAEDINDPIEPFNRAVFSFNNAIDEYFMEPVAKGYDFIVPDPAQKGISNFFRNIDTPIYLVSDILQLKFTQAGIHTARFAINSTVGVLGFLDLAEDWGLEHHPEDIGSAFGNWGIGEGFYLVLPILGPSSLRDGIGLGVETFLSPTIAVTYSDMPQSDKNLIIYGSNSLRFINIRSRLIDPVQSAKQASLDYYSFVKNSYHQNRQGVIFDGMPPEDEEMDLEE